MGMKTTTDHQTIQSWAEALGGQPQRINDPTAQADAIGIRINFQGGGDDAFMPSGEVQNISWQEFFDRFDQQQLAFVYDDHLETSNAAMVSESYRFVKRDLATKPVDQAGRQFMHKKEVIEEFQSRNDD